MTNVLLAEDDAAIAEPLARALTREGYGCEVVSTGADALEKALDSRYELLILDLGLPVLDGLEVCRRVRAQRPALAVLMLTARTDEVDFVVGLDAGADDYVGKPFRLAELLARVRALLRRRQPGDGDEVLEGGEIRLDARARRVLVNGQDLTLANREFDLLRFLMERAGEVVSREEILTEVWGSADLRSSKTLDMHISWLRRKIGDDRHNRPRHIVTVRGVGFRFDP
ncbi:response regulator transcription factor [Gordonia rubripertincta]|uniref:Response regulator transcription factor n=2 Tax=Gordonia rubripertincta TaxID=36822 RepID=A0AAW4G2A2_GORRU|nr:response regulator transcription factor [Gordonia rubripertincta]MBM7277596.1 response regulator transcription factor [Gordonia rubripertincta]MDG6780094.1 response regulator transcription factor [Gordonia rubripertincta]NKY65212.1 response regulator transcription factor [Gordonia rubripertincta]QMU20272.1 response regulator transcription factor [Gordonia rubripertincta]GAB83304.1 putative two-component response regulator [Gordonia rubripertincta NBRC 101908]